MTRTEDATYGTDDATYALAAADDDDDDDDDASFAAAMGWLGPLEPPAETAYDFVVERLVSPLWIIVLSGLGLLCCGCCCAVACCGTGGGRSNAQVDPRNRPSGYTSQPSRPKGMTPELMSARTCGKMGDHY